MADKSSAYGEKLFGLHEVKFVSMDGLTVVDLPVSQKLTFKERVISAESAGDDAIQAIQTVPIAVDWELEHGGIPLPAYALITGRTLSVDGPEPGRDGNAGRDGGAVPVFPDLRQEPGREFGRFPLQDLQGEADRIARGRPGVRQVHGAEHEGHRGGRAGWVSVRVRGP